MPVKHCILPGCTNPVTKDDPYYCDIHSIDLPINLPHNCGICGGDHTEDEHLNTTRANREDR